MRSLLFLTAATFLLTASFQGLAGSPFVVIKAGHWDRHDTPVTFDWPDELSLDGNWRFRAGQGVEDIPVQVDRNGKATLILPHLEKENSIQGSLENTSTGAATSGTVSVNRDDGSLSISVNEHLVTRYYVEPSELPRADIDPLYKRSGYLHPVLTPSGRLVSDDFPENHTHHHGIWFPWTDTRFQGRDPDFWNMGQGKGRVETVSLENHWSGPVHGGFQAKHRFVDMTADPEVSALNETWDIRTYAAGRNKEGVAFWMFDLTSTQTTATDDPLILPEYRYGGLGFRGNGEWNGEENVYFLTSSGITNRVEGHTTRSRWCYVGGKVEGKQSGVVILSHPSNYRFPQPMRLHPSEPFFCYAPQQLGEMRIEPGTPYVSQYRFIVHDGDPDADWYDRLWRDYASPPEVRLE